MKYFSSNLTFLRKKLEKNQGEVSLALGFTNRSRYSNYEAGHSKPDLDTMILISTYFKRTIDDLLFKDLESNDLDNTSILMEPQEEYKPISNKIIVTVDEFGTDNITFVDHKAAAGYPENITEPTYYKKLPSFKLPGQIFRNGSFRCFQVSGDSMADTIYNGDWVICRHLTDGISSIKEGYIHVVVTRSSLLVKRVLNRVSERNLLVLVSDNELHNDIEIPAEDVAELWVVVSKISFNLPKRGDDIQVRLMNLESDVRYLKNNLKNH